MVQHCVKKHPAAGSGLLKWAGLLSLAALQGRAISSSTAQWATEFKDLMLRLACTHVALP